MSISCMIFAHEIYNNFEAVTALGWRTLVEVEENHGGWGDAIWNLVEIQRSQHRWKILFVCREKNKLGHWFVISCFVEVFFEYRSILQVSSFRYHCWKLRNNLGKLVYWVFMLYFKHILVEKAFVFQFFSDRKSQLEVAGLCPIGVDAETGNHSFVSFWHLW